MASESKLLFSDKIMKHDSLLPPPVFAVTLYNLAEVNHARAFFEVTYYLEIASLARTATVS